MARSLVLLAAGPILLAACAQTKPVRPASPDLGAWVGSSTDGATVQGRALLLAPPTLAPRTLAPLPAAPVRPRRGAPVDVSFQGADMTSAFQFLADAGRFNLVMEDGLTGRVSARLRGVDPYDALVSIASAHGVSVRFSNEIVVVGKRWRAP